MYQRAKEGEGRREIEGAESWTGRRAGKRDGGTETARDGEKGNEKGGTGSVGSLGVKRSQQTHVSSKPEGRLPSSCLRSP